MSYADNDKTGKIDDNEKSIFDNFMKQFDMNKDGKVEEDDVPLYRQSVELTEDEKKAESELKLYKEKYGSQIVPKLSDDEIKDFKEILNRCPSFDKDYKRLQFAEMSENALKYLKDLILLQNDVYKKIVSKYNLDNIACRLGILAQQ